VKLAFITPTAYLNKFATQGDLYLALAHLIDDNGENEYACFHRRKAEQGDRVILDNGLFEGAQVTTDELLRRADTIRAQVVCAPDVLYDSKGTIKEFKQFIRAKQEYGLVCDVMGIPQANNPINWWECFQFMQHNRDCSIIGLSILSVPKSFTPSNPQQPITSSRVRLIRELYALSYISGRRLKPMHLLGLGESYEDIQAANYLLSRDVVSNDSSSAFVHGLNGVRYRREGSIPGGKIHKKLDFSIPEDALVSPKDDLNIQHNINTAKEIANGIRR
jgi:hypothetical protein